MEYNVISFADNSKEGNTRWVNQALNMRTGREKF